MEMAASVKSFVFWMRWLVWSPRHRYAYLWQKTSEAHMLRRY